MKNVDLNNLTEKDFEILSKDILSYKLNIPFRTFHGYKDGGIDGLSLDEDKNWIMQAKFFKDSSLSTIMSNLKKEAIKVKKIKPERYFLFLFAEKITVKNYQEILQLFSPYLKKEDFYDAKLIQEILEEKSAEYIIDKWDKLWLPSPYFVEKFYERFKKTNYSYEKSEIINDSKIFVETGSYRKAQELLENKNIILIHGEPGAGKTSIAKRLALKYITQNYDFIFENANNLGDIENYLYDEKNKVILIDDFLGQTVLGFNSVSDNKLYSIINYAKKHSNVKLILTTRTYIYNGAKQLFEKFDDISERLDSLLVEVKEYTPFEKEQILYNHLYYNNLLWSLEYVEIVRQRYYAEIIYHPNFTPRNVKKICEIIKEDRPDSVIKTIGDYLDNPEHIWEHEYAKVGKSDFGKYEKIILDLVSFAISDMNEEKLMSEFQKFVDPNEYENDLFYNSVKELSNAFLRISLDVSGRKIYSILNPSMEDFIKNKLKNDTHKMKKYISKIDDLDILYNICIHFEDESHIQFMIKEKVLQILENASLYWINKEKLYIILKINQLTDDMSIMKRIIDNAFEINSENNTLFIFNVLLDQNSGEVYSYCLDKFKEHEFSDSDKVSWLYNLYDMDDLESYLAVCKKIVKKKDSKFMMSIIEILIDSFISAVYTAASEMIYDDIEDVIGIWRSGKSIEEIWNEYSKMEMDDIEILKDLYTAETLNYIVETVLDNVDLGIFEEDLLEAEVQLKLSDEKNKEEEEPLYYEHLFDSEYENQEELLNNYFRNNIKDSQNVEWLIDNQNSWYLQEFIKDNEGLKFLTQVLNESELLPRNPYELGNIIIEYLDKRKMFYVEYLKRVIDLSNKLIFAPNRTLNMNREKNINFEVIYRLIDDGILWKDSRNMIRFSNKFYEKYFVNKSINLTITSLYDYEKIFEEEDFLELFNMMSYDNLKKFNEEFVFDRLGKYTKYIRNKDDKMNVVKSFIQKLSPTVYVKDSLNYNSVIYKSNSVFEYIGLHPVDALTDVDYRKISKFLDEHHEQYKSKFTNYKYSIDFKQVIKDHEAVKVFGTLKIWDNLYIYYQKMLNLQAGKKDKDYYLYFEKKQY